MTGRSPGHGDRDDLVRFLNARLQDDETAAQRAITAARDVLPITAIEEAADHRARHSPIRVLRDVAAKRAMVQMWLDGVRAEQDQPQVPGLDVADAMLMALVVVYAEHPDFRLDWLATDRPDPVPHPGRTSETGRPGAGPDNIIAFPGSSRGVPRPGERAAQQRCRDERPSANSDGGDPRWD